MRHMGTRTLYANADECRYKTRCYLEQLEASFLLRLAGEFERLAEYELGARRQGVAHAACHSPSPRRRMVSGACYVIAA
jgi:hypothetical protein